MKFFRSRCLDAISPRNTAIMVVDLQNVFVEERGMIFVPGARRVVRPILSLVKTLRTAGGHVVWTRASHEGEANSVYRKLWPDHFTSEGGAILARDSWDYQFVDEIEGDVEAGDIKVEKNSYSAFCNTGLTSILHERGVDTILFSGVSTNVCVESSLRDAFALNFTPVLISDCTATFSDDLQEHSEVIIAMVFGYVMKAREVVASLLRSTEL